MVGIVEKEKKRIYHALNALVLLLSVSLIVYISIDTFTNVNFLHDHYYMTFQLWVCIVFMADFFIELYLSDRRWVYVRNRWIFFLLSIPYLNIIDYLQIELGGSALYFVRFIPLARGALAMTLIVGYVSSNRITSLLASYTIVLFSIIYFGSLIFMEQEHSVNPDVPNYGSALWWACMTATTLGSYIYPVTAPGKIIGCVLAVMGMVMFPLFTVFITDLVSRYNRRLRQSRQDQEKPPT